MAWMRPFQPLKSPTTRTAWAFGAHTVNAVPTSCEVIQGAARKKMDKIPEEAFREAIANALSERKTSGLSVHPANIAAPHNDPDKAEK